MLRMSDSGGGSRGDGFRQVEVVRLEAGWFGFVSDTGGAASVQVGCRNWGSDEAPGSR